MKTFSTILLFLFFSATIFAQLDQKPWVKSEMMHAERQMTLSKINYPGDSKYDVTYYKLNLEIDYPTQNLKGEVTINAKADTQNVTAIFLDLTSPLNVDSVLLNGSPAVFSHVADILNVNLDGTYNTGDEFSIVVYYEGTPGSSGFGSFEFSTHSSSQTPVIWTLSEPYGAKDWWPCKDTPADKVDSADVWCTVSTSMIVGSNGTLEDVVDNGNGTHTFKWKVSYPIAHYLLSLAITNYTQYYNYYNYSPTDSMEIAHYIYPESFTAFTKQQLDKTPQMIEVFAEHFGEYPFINEKYGHAQFGWGGGMEHQTMTSLGGFSEGLIAHELAHQWYGDAVTCKDWHHIWLNEGFATYAEGVWIEATQGKAAYNNYIAGEMNRAKNATGSIWVQNISSVSEIFNSYRSYSKGCVVLHMLRGVVGDSIFYDIMRTYTYHPSLAYGVAVTEDFQAIAENLYGSSLDYFFDEWIYGESFPRYNVAWSRNQISASEWDFSLSINQQVLTNPAYFTMPVQVKVLFENSDTTITVFNDQQDQTFNMTFDRMPISIVFDPNNYILKNIYSITVVSDANLPVKFELQQNYPNPFNPTTTIKYSVAETVQVELKIYDTIGNEVATLVTGVREQGSYEVNFDASSLTSGVYFYQLKAGDFVSTKKMILLK